MTFENIINVPGQLIINGEVIDVIVQTVSTENNESPVIHEEKYKDSNGHLFTESHITDKINQTLTTFKCIKI